MLEKTIRVSWLEGEISLWCIRAFYLPGPPPQLCKPHSPPATTDAHLMGEELVQPQAWEGQERGREKHKKEGKWRETSWLTPASPSLSTPAAARPASAEPWLVSDGGTEGGGCTPEVSQEAQRVPKLPQGRCAAWAPSCPTPGTEKEVAALHIAMATRETAPLLQPQSLG